MSDGLERNDERWWFDRGYALAVAETQLDAIIPRLVGAWCLVGVTAVDPLIGVSALAMYTVLSLPEYLNRRDEVEDRRERHNPGKRYSWGADDE